MWMLTISVCQNCIVLQVRQKLYETFIRSFILESQKKVLISCHSQKPSLLVAFPYRPRLTSQNLTPPKKLTDLVTLGTSQAGKLLSTNADSTSWLILILPNFWETTNWSSRCHKCILSPSCSPCCPHRTRSRWIHKSNTWVEVRSQNHPLRLHEKWMCQNCLGPHLICFSYLTCDDAYLFLLKMSLKQKKLDQDPELFGIQETLDSSPLLRRRP